MKKLNRYGKASCALLLLLALCLLASACVARKEAVQKEDSGAASGVVSDTSETPICEFPVEDATLTKLTVEELRDCLASVEAQFAAPELALVSSWTYEAYLNAVKAVTFGLLEPALAEGMGALSDDVRLFSGVYSPGYIILSDSENGLYDSAKEMLRTVWSEGSTLTLETCGCPFFRFAHDGVYACDGAGEETRLFPSEEQLAVLDSLPAGSEALDGIELGQYEPEKKVDPRTFRLLSEGFTYAQMVYLLGYPSRPVGSGLWIDGYELSDGSLGLVWILTAGSTYTVEHIVVDSAEDREAQAEELAAVYLRAKVYAAISEVDQGGMTTYSSAYPDLNDPEDVCAKEWNAHFSEFDASAAPFVLEWILESEDNGFFEAFLVSGANRLAGQEGMLGAVGGPGAEDFLPYDCEYEPYTPKWYAYQLFTELEK